ncbi:chemotaxis signal transduction protein CheV [Ectothiorhodospiraceae bacterium BW-2]|nr:chemotaxis signal transduction protein CheV [Ectothiorhodospiraceae bacterium BW-2]
MADNALTDEIEQRTNLAYSNKMEMLTFFLTDRQLYGINVFKIIEIIETPKHITYIPLVDAAIVGTINYRGSSVTVIDIARLLGMEAVSEAKEGCRREVLLCEYSGTIQGLMICHSNELIIRSWEEIKNPGQKLNYSTYLTALAYDDRGRTVQILDIEKLLADIVGIKQEVSESIRRRVDPAAFADKPILLVDDSKSARMFMQSVLEQLGFRYTLASSAKEGMERLQESLGEGRERYAIIISDIEMPDMDGFSFTRAIRTDEQLQLTPVILHSSMSNKTNESKAKNVGANEFVGKYNPDELARVILKLLQQQ